MKFITQWRLGSILTSPLVSDGLRKVSNGVQNKKLSFFQKDSSVLASSAEHITEWVAWVLSSKCMAASAFAR